MMEPTFDSILNGQHFSWRYVFVLLVLAWLAGVL
jgi:hypothetical protein